MCVIRGVTCAVCVRSDVCCAFSMCLIYMHVWYVVCCVPPLCMYCMPVRFMSVHCVLLSRGCLHCVCACCGGDIYTHVSACRTGRSRFYNPETQGQADRGFREVGDAVHLPGRPREPRK